ncbi:MAG: hypothetical protein GY694_11460 [Gammaproteobacteria bacterium]|nr:hypothetical protein [Gammaproteobacteria bacterium]
MSTAPLQEEQEIETMAESIMLQFNQSIKSQEAMNLQINRRTSRIILFGTFAFILLFITIAMIVWSLKQDIGVMTVYMEEMAQDASDMNKTMSQMKYSTRAMEKGINQVVRQTEFISTPTNQGGNSDKLLLSIADSVKLMQGDTSSFNGGINNLNNNLNRINKQMKSLNRRLGSISQDVNRMPSPGNMFPF